MAQLDVTGTTVPLGTVALGGISDLGIAIQYQDEDEWCWAACIDMLLKWKGDQATEQWQLANAAFNCSGCQLYPDSSLCNKPLPVPQVSLELNRWQFSNQFGTGPLPLNAVMSGIDSQSAIEVGIVWSPGSGGHAVLITGYNQGPAATTLKINDPCPIAGLGGIQNVEYQKFCTSYLSRGSWRFSWSGVKP